MDDVEEEITFVTEKEGTEEADTNKKWHRKCIPMVTKETTITILEKKKILILHISGLGIHAQVAT